MVRPFLRLAEYLHSQGSSLAPEVREELALLLEKQLQYERSWVPASIKHLLDDPNDLEKLRSVEDMIFDIQE